MVVELERTFIELSPNERLNLLYKLLFFISQNPHLTTTEIREAFRAQHLLTETAVIRLIDLLFFSDMIRYEHRGIPPKLYYVLTNYGKSIIPIGKLELEHFTQPPPGIYIPEWVVETITRPPRLPPPPIRPNFARAMIRDFTFFITSDWKYKTFVETPIEWIAPWQMDIPEMGKIYSVKHRTIVFLCAVGVGQNYFAGYRWFPWPPDRERIYIEGGRVPSAPPITKQRRPRRTMMFDPQGRVVPRYLGEFDGKKRWVVDFIKLKDEPAIVTTNPLAKPEKWTYHLALLPVVDLAHVIDEVNRRGYKADMVRFSSRRFVEGMPYLF